MEAMGFGVDLEISTFPLPLGIISDYITPGIKNMLLSLIRASYTFHSYQ